jgi:hypothetical protein
MGILCRLGVLVVMMMIHVLHAISGIFAPCRQVWKKDIHRVCLQRLDEYYRSKLGGKIVPLATVPGTTRILSNTGERENMNCKLKRTSAKEVRGVLL